MTIKTGAIPVDSRGNQHNATHLLARPLVDMYIRRMMWLSLRP